MNDSVVQINSGCEVCGDLWMNLPKMANASLQRPILIALENVVVVNGAVWVMGAPIDSLMTTTAPVLPNGTTAAHPNVLHAFLGSIVNCTFAAGRLAL